MPDAAEVTTTETPGATGAPGTSGAAKPLAEGVAGRGAGAPSPGASPGRGPDGRFQGKEGEQAPAPRPKVRVTGVKSRSGGVEDLELDEDELRQHLSLAREGQYRLQQLARERKTLEEERQRFQQEREALKSIWKDPAALRKHLHENVTDQKEAHRIKVQLVKLDLDEQNMTPEQKRLQELEAKEAERAEQEEQAARERAEKELLDRAERLRPHFVKTLSTVLDLGGLPVTPSLLGRAAEKYKENAQHNYGLDEKGLAAWLKEELDDELDARMSDPELSDEVFVQRYAKVYERARRIAVDDMRKRRAQGRGTGPHATQAPVVRPPEEKLGPDGTLPPRRVLSAQERANLYGGG